MKNNAADPLEMLLRPRVGEGGDAAGGAVAAGAGRGTRSSKAAHNNIAAMAHDAELGFLELASALLSIPEVTVSLGSLVITTTKLDGTARAWLNREQDGVANGAPLIPRPSIARCRLLSSEQVDKCPEGFTYRIVLHSGLTWFLDALEAPLRAMWASCGTERVKWWHC